MVKVLDNKVRGVRVKMPSGYILGRTEKGVGKAQMLNGTALRSIIGPGIIKSMVGPVVITVQEEGNVTSSTVNTLNFVGTGVTATGSGATETITVPGLISKDEGSTLVDPTLSLNFVGAGVVATNSGGNVTVTIEGGASSSSGNYFSWPLLSGAVLSTVDSNSDATKGTYIVPTLDFTIVRVLAFINSVSGATYRAAVYTVDGTLKITAVQDGSAVVAGATTTGVVLSLPLTATLVAGTAYVIAVRRTDGGDTYVLPLYSSGASTVAQFPGVPNTPTTTTYFQKTILAKAAPAINDTFSALTNGLFYTGLKMDI